MAYCGHTSRARLKRTVSFRTSSSAQTCCCVGMTTPVTIAGGFAAAQLTSDYTEANGIRLPTKRRAYLRGPTASRSATCS